jgi:hypothetical protein
VHHFDVVTVALFTGFQVVTVARWFLEFLHTVALFTGFQVVTVACWFLEFLHTVAFFFTGFQVVVTVTLFTGFQVVTAGFLHAVAGVM